MWFVHRSRIFVRAFPCSHGILCRWFPLTIHETAWEREELGGGRRKVSHCPTVPLSQALKRWDSDLGQAARTRTFHGHLPTGRLKSVCLPLGKLQTERRANLTLETIREIHSPHFNNTVHGGIEILWPALAKKRR